MIVLTNLQGFRVFMPFIALVIFLGIVFLTGGSSRDDVQTLLILRPAAVIACGVALWSLRMHHVRSNAFLFGMMGALFALVIFHLIPMPRQMWTLLPGRSVLAAVDREAGFGSIWRPISMVPSATWNALYSLFIPLAVLMLVVQLTRKDIFRLLSVILIFGFLNGLWVVLQAVTSQDSALFLYRLTSDGRAIGLFANRNHQALFLATLFPMLAVYASLVKTADEAKRKLIVAAALGIFLVPLMLVTGSRAGLVIGIIALVLAAFLYKVPTVVAPRRRAGRTFSFWIPFAALMVLCVGITAVLMARAEALTRLIAPDQADELRFRVWGPIVHMGWKYFPVGSGVGSFVEVYQIDEPYALLSSTYLNHAHNDWVEIFLTAGLPGLLLLGIALYAFGWAAVAAFRRPDQDSRNTILKKLGAIIIALLALGSLGDYPLRTPWLMCVFVISALWLSGTASRETNNAGNG
jgi:O-antigen ligase